jgi:hypothetical protein
MRTALSVTADGLGGEPSRLRSNLVRVLPTTAALALVWPYLYRDAHTSQPVHAASAIWAGDSRIYLLQPATGLSQVTVDDTRVEMDALQSLQSDPPLDNCLSASADFTLHSAVWEFEGLGIVIAATDGCFGYMPTPAHFEAVLLDSLAGAAGPTEWQAVLTERIGAVAADDATLAAAVVGSKSFEQLKTAFAPRLATLVERFVAPYNRRDEAVRASERELEVATARRTELVEARATCAQQLWDQYRPGYEKMLPAPVEEGPAE